MKTTGMGMPPSSSTRTTRAARAGVRSAALGLALALAVAGGVTGCGDSATERWQEAVDDLEGAREEVRKAEEKVDSRREALREAEAALAEARQREAKAQEKVDEARADVSEEATDEVLFRAVQKRLLEDETLEDVAISAQVRDGVVILRGTVPDAELRDRAVQVARSVPGVAGVESEIRVRQPQAQGEAT